jgi:dienelactone hydrolase
MSPLLRWLLLFAFGVLAGPAAAQSVVRLDVDDGGRHVRLASELYRPKGTEPAPAVAIFHGCGGPGQNTARMGALFQSWGYVALIVDSFSGRGLKDVCGRNWPSQADAERRARDIDAALGWLRGQSSVDGHRLAFMGYSYGGGVAALRAFKAEADDTPAAARAAILLYPDCALADGLGGRLTVRQPTLLAMGELDDWTPVSQCRAVVDRVTSGRDLVESHIYAGAHHSFDALGLPVRYLDGVGNRSKPGGCCGAHYGANEAAWKAFVVDLKAFLSRTLGR